eukprot:2637572-Amphidinium_carterae.1
MQLIASNTHFEHAILATRCGYRQEGSSMDYICTSPLVHGLVPGCDVFPVASKSDHYMARLQLKPDAHTRHKRGRGKFGHWESSEFCIFFKVLCQWRCHIKCSNGSKQCYMQLMRQIREKAKDYWELRKRAVGNERRELSKMLYTHLKRTKARDKLACIVVDANGVTLKPVQALETFQGRLWGKVKAIGKEEWTDGNITFPQMEGLASEVIGTLTVKHERELGPTVCHLKL